MRRIGIVGGTFDPIHTGHLMLGKQAYKEYQLDEIWYMPSRQPPHKTDHPVTEAAKRFEMVRLAILDTPYFKLSDFELTRLKGNTYTADTLRLLKDEYPDVEFFFIVGADSIYEIESWYHPAEVLRLATILAAGRECGEYSVTLEEQARYLEHKYKAKIKLLHCQELDISSEEIRRRASQGKNIEKFLPKAVEQYIIQHHLYAMRGEENE